MNSDSHSFPRRATASPLLQALRLWGRRVKRGVLPSASDVSAWEEAVAAERTAGTPDSPELVLRLAALRAALLDLETRGDRANRSGGQRESRATLALLWHDVLEARGLRRRRDLVEATTRRILEIESRLDAVPDTVAATTRPGPGLSPFLGARRATLTLGTDYRPLRREGPSPESHFQAPPTLDRILAFIRAREAGTAGFLGSLLFRASAPLRPGAYPRLAMPFAPWTEIELDWIEGEPNPWERAESLAQIQTAVADLSRQGAPIVVVPGRSVPASSYTPAAARAAADIVINGEDGPTSLESLAILDGAAVVRARPGSIRVVLAPGSSIDPGKASPIPTGSSSWMSRLPLSPSTSAVSPTFPPRRRPSGQDVHRIGGQGEAFGGSGEVVRIAVDWVSGEDPWQRPEVLSEAREAMREWDGRGVRLELTRGREVPVEHFRLGEGRGAADFVVATSSGPTSLGHLSFLEGAVLMAQRPGQLRVLLAPREVRHARVSSFPHLPLPFARPDDPPITNTDSPSPTGGAPAAPSRSSDPLVAPRSDTAILARARTQTGVSREPPFPIQRPLFAATDERGMQAVSREPSRRDQGSVPAVDSANTVQLTLNWVSGEDPWRRPEILDRTREAVRQLEARLGDRGPRIEIVRGREVPVSGYDPARAQRPADFAVHAPGGAVLLDGLDVLDGGNLVAQHPGAVEVLVAPGAGGAGFDAAPITGRAETAVPSVWTPASLSYAAKPAPTDESGAGGQPSFGDDDVTDGFAVDTRRGDSVETLRVEVDWVIGHDPWVGETPPSVPSELIAGLAHRGIRLELVRGNAVPAEAGAALDTTSSAPPEPIFVSGRSGVIPLDAVPFLRTAVPLGQRPGHLRVLVPPGPSPRSTTAGGVRRQGDARTPLDLARPPDPAAPVPVAFPAIGRLLASERAATVDSDAPERFGLLSAFPPRPAAELSRVRTTGPEHRIRTGRAPEAPAALDPSSMVSGDPVISPEAGDPMARFDPFVPSDARGAPDRWGVTAAGGSASGARRWDLHVGHPLGIPGAGPRSPGDAREPTGAEGEIEGGDPLVARLLRPPRAFDSGLTASDPPLPRTSPFDVVIYDVTQLDEAAPPDRPAYLPPDLIQAQSAPRESRPFAGDQPPSRRGWPFGVDLAGYDLPTSLVFVRDEEPSEPVPVARARADRAPVLPAEATSGPSSTTTTTSGSTATGAVKKPDLDQLARQVYSEIKWRLAIERERVGVSGVFRD